MIKCFPIEFVRIALTQTLYKAHIQDSYLFGGNDQINILSFYEQVKNQDEVDRFVETYRDLTEQQNNSGLIGSGVVVSPENPTITNLYSCLIIPMTFTCSIRTKLSNRDEMIETINNLIEELKGSKVDMAQLECVDDNGKKCYVPFAVGTIGYNDNAPMVSKGDYIGKYVAFENHTNIKGSSIPISAFDISGNDLVYSFTYNLDNVNIYSYEITDQTCNYDMSVGVSGNIVSVTITIENGAITTPATPAIYSITIDYVTRTTLNTYITSALTSLSNMGISNELTNGDYIYYSENESGGEILKVAILVDGVWEEQSDEQAYPNVVFPNEHTNFEKYKLSMSFEAIRCDEPRTLNGDMYCEISFGGSATLVNNGVGLGNDLTKIGISKNKIVASTDISLNGTTYYLEPLELPSTNNTNTIISQLASNNFKQNTHTDGIAISLQYSFILDKNVDLLNQWFMFARYGTYGITTNDISPNMIYNVSEYWSSWGNVEVNTYLGKIVENIEISNTESDTLTIGVNMQVQGENN